MSQTIVFSGPTANVSQCRNALAGVGFKVANTGFNWGLPPLPSGDAPTIEQSFVTIYGDAINQAVSLVEQYGFILRSHFPDSALLPLVDMSAPGGDVSGELRELREQVQMLLAKAAG